VVKGERGDRRHTHEPTRSEGFAVGPREDYNNPLRPPLHWSQRGEGSGTSNKNYMTSYEEKTEVQHRESTRGGSARAKRQRESTPPLSVGPRVSQDGCDRCRLCPFCSAVKGEFVFCLLRFRLLRSHLYA